MPKFYTKSHNLELIISTSDPLEASVRTLLSCNKNDVVDEFFYVDERGFRDYTNADAKTTVIDTKSLIRAAQSELYGDDE